MTILVLVIVAVIAYFWCKRRKGNAELYDSYPQRKQTEEDERQEGLILLMQGLTSDPEFNARTYVQLLDAARRFNRKGEKQEEMDLLNDTAAQLASIRGVSADEAYRMIRIVYWRCTPQELHDAYQRSVNSGSSKM